MNIVLRFVYFFVVFFVAIFQSCVDLEDEKVVKKKCRWFLNLKYGENFKVLEFSQSMSGASWKYSTSLLMVPESIENVVFDLSYNAYDGTVYSDNYKSTLWYWQFNNELKSYFLGYKWPAYIDGMFGDNLNHLLSCSEMKYIKNYDSVLQNMELPVSKTYLYLGYQKDKLDEQIGAILDICELLKDKPFVVNKFEVYFCSSDFFSKKLNKYNKKSSLYGDKSIKKQLFFKFTAKDSLPSKLQLQKMIVDINGDSVLVNKNKKLFDLAQNETELKESMKYYQEIISNVSNYRFNTYAPFQSAYKVEALFNIAELHFLNNEKKKALYYYEKVLDYFIFEQSSSKLFDYLENAENRLKEIKVDN